MIFKEVFQFLQGKLTFVFICLVNTDIALVDKAAGGEETQPYPYVGILVALPGGIH